jgi:hypothetical protein
MKEEFNKDMENLRKKRIKKKPWKQKFLKSNKKHRRKPLQQTVTTRRQNLRT